MLEESLENVLEEELELSSFASLSESLSLVDVRSLILILWFLIVPWLGLVWVLTDPEFAPLNLKLTLLLFCLYLTIYCNICKIYLTICLNFHL